MINWYLFSPAVFGYCNPTGNGLTVLILSRDSDKSIQFYNNIMKQQSHGLNLDMTGPRPTTGKSGVQEGHMICSGRLQADIDDNIIVIFNNSCNCSSRS